MCVCKFNIIFCSHENLNAQCTSSSLRSQNFRSQTFVQGKGDLTQQLNQRFIKPSTAHRSKSHSVHTNSTSINRKKLDKCTYTQE